MKFISAADLKDLVSKNPELVVVDLRESYERAICTIPSIHIPMHDFAQFEQFDCSKEIILFCKSGRRAEAVANLLTQELNFTNLLVLSGGISAWIDEVDASLENY